MDDKLNLKTFFHSAIQPFRNFVCAVGALSPDAPLRAWPSAWTRLGLRRRRGNAHSSLPRGTHPQGMASIATCLKGDTYFQ